MCSYLGKGRIPKKNAFEDLAWYVYRDVRWQDWLGWKNITKFITKFHKRFFFQVIPTNISVRFIIFIVNVEYQWKESSSGIKEYGPLIL